MFGDTPLLVVQDDQALAEAAAILTRSRVIGVDTESDSFHHYQEKVCLIQVSDPEHDWVIDPLALSTLEPLAPVFANPAQVKIFHGADYDVVSMKRDFGFTFDGVFDTMIAAQFLGLPRVGLADLIERWFGHQLDKQWQRHDWAARPLLPEHLDYARGDSHFLPALRDVMIHHLRRVGRLERVMEECAAVQGRRWSARAQDPAAYQRARGAKQLDETGGRVLRALWAYRDGQAREMDRPVFKVIPDEVLVDLAGVRPTTAEGVAARLRRGSPLARRHGEGLARAVAVGLADETPLPAPAPSTQRAPGQLRGPVAERLFGRLKEWRNRRMEEEGLPAVAVLSNGVLTAVARRAPRQVDELAEVEELRSWQRDAFGADLVAVVNEVLAPSEAAAEPRRRRRRGRGRAAAGTGADEAFEPADSRVD